MDPADLELFERSLRHATEAHTGAQLDAAVAEIGWHDALTFEPRAAVSLLFDLQGRANATSSALDAVVRTALGSSTDGAGIVLPAADRSHPPATLDGDRVMVDGLASAAFTDHDTAFVMTANGDGNRGAVVDRSRLTVRPVSGVDADAGWVVVTGDLPASEVNWVDDGTADWGSAVGLAQLAIGHELVGGAKTMLELAREHALERIQFGKPISMFQAIRHRLAESLVAIETAEAVLTAAWDGHAASAGSAAQHAVIAKASAGRGARTAARHCQQVLGGIGFTTEHAFHRYVWRMLALDPLFGTSGTLTRQLGEALRETKQLPALVPL